ncbi:glycosyl hydrolase family 61-domain-containing protein [Podospora aff. communis PSN243]|uniref:lytic cellulose monooxygenase (C4-dehydrogenating) n=1 Tax=Podospora aff. communis PSN243 TaxID=3040156 RepID=A0AAV9GF21_9PEZI|nr:glycosyl hydrolase family 61-domain-containing protein [Podospora aff. communis PSN243]
MKSSQLVFALATARHALGHGYIYRVTADNTIYPGWDVAIDPWLNPPPARIAYGGGIVGPIINISSPNLACNMGRSPAPSAIAEVRAGSTMTFHWSNWLQSHKGPITAWMAPYTGDVSKVNVNELEFFKFAEDTVDENGVWANIRMVQANNTFTATIPADVKSGTYIVRHEIAALHFSLGTAPGFELLPVAAQFYMTCFNVRVTEGGDATPKGVKFPGAYKADEKGMRFDVKGGDGRGYTPLGPEVYWSEYDVEMEEKEVKVVSPTGQGEAADEAYWNAQKVFLERQGGIVAYFDSIGG